MLTRIVKLTINTNKKEDFLSFITKNKHLIINFEGCHKLHLLQDRSNSDIFFTYSIWENEKSIINYKNSDVFLNLWAEAKKNFSARPEAWSLEKLF